MAYNVPTDAIQSGVLYKVIGTKSVTYNSISYATNAFFRGVDGITTFSYTGTGTEEVNETTELKGSGIELLQDNEVYRFPEETVLRGFGVEYVQQGRDIVFNDTTTIKGFAIEYVDYPIYAFQILTRRL